MADYRLVLNPINSPGARPQEVYLFMQDPWVGDNTWQINTPNTWIGNNWGVYEYLPHYYILVFYWGEDKDSKHQKMRLFRITYPDDCRGPAKNDRGEYYTNGQAPALQWRRGDIITPEPDSD